MLELVGKRMELLKNVMPKLTKVAILANPEHPGDQAELRASQAAARAVVSGWARFAEGGCLMTYGPNLSVVFRRLATFVDRVLRGAKPVELPTAVELVVNLKTATALGIKVSPAVLARADRVIE